MKFNKYIFEEIFLSGICFNKIEINTNRIDIHCKSVGDSLDIDDTLYFEFSEDITVDENQIALALATLCGKVYDRIFMDLNINKCLLDDIADFTNAEIQVNKVMDEDFVNDLSEDNLMLGFSGGFDSLAEYNLLKDCDFFENVYLVSLDLQGRFSREKEFFKIFEPFTVKTNIVDLKLNRNHWSFMYIPQILFSSFLDAKYISVSAEFHAGPYGFDEKFTLNSRTNQIPLSYLGLERIPFTMGLTGIGTSMITIHYTPELIDLSLKSLANKGEEKRYRKQLIIDILSKKYNKKVFLEHVKEGNKHKWNRMIGLDFFSLYFIKNAGIDEASKVMAGIPDEAIEFANSLSLDFYEKYNINFLNSIPERFRLKFLQKLVECGIYPYNSVDWKEYFEVSEFLSNYYPALKKRLNK